MRKLVAELFDPTTTYEFEAALPSDIVRALQIDTKFSELELGLVDGIVAAVAERRRVYRILTIDRRDFGVLRIGERYTRSLTLLPEQA
jgi:predicted nucleic acid-binding protein